MCTGHRKHCHETEIIMFFSGNRTGKTSDTEQVTNICCVKFHNTFSHVVNVKGGTPLMSK